MIHDVFKVIFFTRMLHGLLVVFCRLEDQLQDGMAKSWRKNMMLKNKFYDVYERS